MRKIVITTFILLVFIVSYCGNAIRNDNGDSILNSQSEGKSEISFREYQHDFGKVSAGEKVSYTFKFDNKGTEDLIILSASATCGCTITDYDKNPVSPGKSGDIEVVFDTSDRRGKQTKTVIVNSNASTKVVLLKITAEVLTTNK